MSNLYPTSDNGVPYGVPNGIGTAGLVPGKWKFWTPAGVERCTCVIEGSPTFNREPIVVRRNGIYGEAQDITIPEDPNNTGFPAMVFNTVSVDAQIPTRTGAQPRGGDYVDVPTGSGLTLERWLVLTVALKTEQANHWTAGITLERDPAAVAS